MTLRVADQRHGQVEPAPHAAGVGRGHLLRRVDADRTGPAARRPGAGPRRRPRWCRSAMSSEVLLAGEQAVDRRELAGDPDRGAHRVGLAGDVVAGDRRLAAVGGGSAWTGSGPSVVLPAPLGPSRAKTVPSRDVAGRCRRARPGHRTTCVTRSSESTVPLPSNRRCGGARHDCADRARSGLHRGFTGFQAPSARSDDARSVLERLGKAPEGLDACNRLAVSAACCGERITCRYSV